ncbi:MAG: DUF5683 domain-containing protein [Candidatus Marinimicrobia bacterium]|nr:DUF5683 domain-containing protein [Candidatus Neomarinimicrobiota bacterium]
MTAFVSAQDSTATAPISPKKAVVFSIIPGGGQLYNGKKIKAALMFGAQLWMLYQFQTNRSSYNSWDDGSYTKPREYYRDNRNKYAWYSAFVYIYNLADALVDSHLSDFDEKDEKVDITQN